MPMAMHFTVTSALPPKRTPNSAFLVLDRWDDWGKFATQFQLFVCDDAGDAEDIGSVKIGRFGMQPNQPYRTELPESFSALDDTYFSLGQSEWYYEALNALGPSIRSAILAGLRDVAADIALLERAAEEPVMIHSLLRHVRIATVQTQLRRMAAGGARLTPYKFDYAPPTRKDHTSHDAPPTILDFVVDPESSPPSNIHVLIGRNGVGKTTMLHNLVSLLRDEKLSAKDHGSLALHGERSLSKVFVTLVSVTFSAFDEFPPIAADSIEELSPSGLRYVYIGLHDRLRNGPKPPAALSSEFVKSVEECRLGPRAERWRLALQTLEADPLFKEAEVANLADPHTPEWRVEASALFRRLSSGHKIVLLTITRLVENVDERTLVLIDEPEAHLHPPLLSAFVRALSDLLTERNGVAVVATHSPVVLQEVPRSCVWVLRRSGTELRAERPTVETFGENVGVLTRDVFGLEVTHSGFHRLISDVVAHAANYDDVVEHFNGQLGTEARILARTMLLPSSESENGRDEPNQPTPTDRTKS